MSFQKSSTALIIFILVLTNVYAFEFTAHKNDVNQRFSISSQEDVNPYTGDLNINYPLLTVPGRNGMDINLLLSYSSNRYLPPGTNPHVKEVNDALKVAPSWAGLGWDLNYGSISCDNRYLQPREEYYDPCGDEIYQIVIPGGISGKIVKDPNAGYVFEKYNYWKVEAFEGNGIILKWVITDDKGTKYYFDNVGYYRELPDFSKNDPYTINYQRNIKWDLTKIVDLNGNEIKAEYSKEKYYANNVYEYNDEFYFKNEGGFEPTTIKTDFISSSRLNKITSPTGHNVKFEFDIDNPHNRLDDGGFEEATTWRQEHSPYEFYHAIGTNWYILGFRDREYTDFNVADHDRDGDKELKFSFHNDAGRGETLDASFQLIQKVDGLAANTQYVFSCDVKYDGDFTRVQNIDFRLSPSVFVWEGSCHNECQSKSVWEICNGNNQICQQRLCDPISPGDYGNYSSYPRYVLTPRNLEYNNLGNWYKFQRTVSSSVGLGCGGTSIFVNLFVEVQLPKIIGEGDVNADIYFDNCELVPAIEERKLEMIKLKDENLRNFAIYDLEYSYLTGIPDQYKGENDSLLALKSIQRVNPLRPNSERLPATEFTYYTSGDGVGAIQKIKYPNGGYSTYAYQNKLDPQDSTWKGTKVTRKTIYDNKGNSYTFNYAYDLGKFDSSEKTYGHSYFEITDPRGFKTKQYFYTDEDNWRKSGLSHKTETQISGENYLIERNTYELAPLSSSSDPYKFYQQRLTNSKKIQENKITEAQYSNFNSRNGLPEQIRELGSGFSVNSERCTINSYWNDPSNKHVTTNPDSATIKEGSCSGDIKSKTEYLYSTNVYDYGELKEQKSYIDNNNFVSEKYQYDQYGNLIAQVSPNGETTTYEYSEEHNYAFPTKVTMTNGFAKEIGYDKTSGAIVWEKDVDERTTKYFYDPFLRLLSIKDDDVYEYENNLCGNHVIDFGEQCDPPGSSYDGCATYNGENNGPCNSHCMCLYGRYREP